MSPVAKPRIENHQRQLVHFSHRHPLAPLQLPQDNAAVCSGCDHRVSGQAYLCTKPKCGFLLHDVCFELPRRLRHRSHSKHPLVLLHTHAEYACDACGGSGHGFTYCCEACRFDLHVECASLPEMEIRDDHRHPLVLVCGVPEKAVDRSCYVCSEIVGKGRWMYSCLACDCGAHLDCVGTDL